MSLSETASVSVQPTSRAHVKSRDGCEVLEETPPIKPREHAIIRSERSRNVERNNCSQAANKQLRRCLNMADNEAWEASR